LNIGTIKGGEATNIVPDKVSVTGEIRSYSHTVIQNKWHMVRETFEKYATLAGAKVVFRSNMDYHCFEIDKSARVIQDARVSFNKHIPLGSSFGGSDANVFNQHGIAAVVLAVGAWEPHTNHEYVLIDEIIQASQWVYDIVCHHVSA
jgi:tripeptide aminopeptidase